jgi:hypothetical protein
VIHEFHANGYRRAGSCVSGNERYAGAMKAEVWAFQIVLEKIPPRLPEHGRWVVERMGYSCVLSALQHWTERGRQRHGERSFAAAFRRDKGDSVSIEVNVTKSDLGSRLAATCLQGDFEASLHPLWLILECPADVNNVLIGEFGFLFGVFFGNSKTVARIGGGVFESDGLAHDDPEDFHVIEGRIEFNSASTTLAIFSPPLEVAKGLLVIELTGNVNASFPQVHAQPTPAERVAFKSTRSSTVTLQEGNDPVFPTLNLAVSGLLVLTCGQLCFECASLSGFGGIVLTELGCLKFSLPSFWVDEFDLPKGGLLNVNERGHRSFHHVHQT